MKYQAPLALIAASILVVIGSGAAQATAPSRVTPKPVKYQNCTELNAVYPHGVAKGRVTDKVRGRTKPVTTFTVAATVYALNRGLDRDRDGIACEKR